MKKLYNIKQDSQSRPLRKGCFSVRTKRIVRFSLLFIWIGLTLFLSEQSGTDSTRISAGLTKAIINFFHLNLKVSQVEGVIRELAHFGIHFILAILAFRAFATVVTEKISILISLILCSAIAIFDEVAQSQITGRAFEFFDLALNLLGVTLGLIIGFLVSKTLQRQKPSQ